MVSRSTELTGIPEDQQEMSNRKHQEPANQVKKAVIQEDAEIKKQGRSQIRFGVKNIAFLVGQLADF